MDRENARWHPRLERVPREEWGHPQYDDGKRLEVWRSRNFLVQVIDEGELGVRLTVNRTAMRPDGEWEDAITWDELQAIKREIGYGDYYAIEVYPKDADLVDLANMRHLWVPLEDLPYGWFRRSAEEPQGKGLR